MDEDGFTLVEVLLALVLFLTVACVMMLAFWHILIQASRMQIAAELQYDARQCRQHLIWDIANSRSFRIADNQGNTVNQGNHLYLTMTAETVHYYQYNGQLYRDSTTGTPLPVAENITFVTFTAWTSKLVDFQISTAKGSTSYDLESAGGSGKYETEMVL